MKKLLGRHKNEQTADEIKREVALFDKTLEDAGLTSEVFFKALNEFEEAEGELYKPVDLIGRD